MNLVRLQYGGGISIEPYTVIVSLDENFEGQPVTLTQGTEIMRKTCPMTSPYVVEFKPMNDGVWVASSTTKYGKVVSVDTEPLLEWGTYNVTLKSSFNFREWLNRGRVKKTFTSLDDVLADQPTVRQLMTVHDSVDYLVTSLSNFADTAEKILDNDICAKWINLRDYALDMLYANANVKAVMDSVDKYGYGEWALIGQVPKMTSNTAPSGEVIGNMFENSDRPMWKVFDGDDSTLCEGQIEQESWIGYKFTKPIKVEKIFLAKKISSDQQAVKKALVQYSDDGNTWNGTTEVTYELSDMASGKYSEVTDTGYHLYWRIKPTEQSTNSFGISNLQFYAWQPKGAIPVMTSNTAPYGEVIHSNVGGYTGHWDANLAYYIFTNDKLIGAYTENANFEIGYKFVNPISVRRIEITGWARAKDYAGKIMAYINNAWVELCELTFSNGIEDKKEIKLDTPTAYATEIKFVSTIPKTPSTGFDMGKFQIYGRELKVSVPKMDNYTTPFGEVIELGYVASGYEGYRVFDNNLSTYWQSNTDHTGMVCYNFEKEVLVKNMHSIMKSPNTGVSKLEGSNTGNSNDWHPIYSDNITAGYPNTKSVPINGNLAYKYYRATITRTDDVPQVTELQFYGLDYSEREFAKDSKVEYIYDHGVKLKTIETSISNGGTIDEQSDQILWATNNKNGVTMLGAKVDVTDKKVARARFGLQAYTNGSDGNMGFMILNNTLAWNTPFNAVKTADMPNNANVNFASGGYSGEYYVIFGADFTGAFNIYNTLQELWVE